MLAKFCNVKVIKQEVYSGKYWATVSGIGVTVSSTYNKPNCFPPVEKHIPLRKLILANLVTAAELGNLNDDTRAKQKTKKSRDVDVEIMQGNVARCSRNTDCQQSIHHPLYIGRDKGLFPPPPNHPVAKALTQSQHVQASCPALPWEALSSQ